VHRGRETPLEDAAGSRVEQSRDPAPPVLQAASCEPRSAIGSREG
jgi:hypothetical protein